ncbi:MAG: NAD(P)H-dependent flavin oxidoreductase, partial [Thermoleophilaceae bacterium]
PEYPVLVAGGIADGADVARALEAGADAAVLGTRFLLSEEANAALAYKQRLMESRETVLTDLFGMGWPAPHRVIWNEAAERWLRRDGGIPGWLSGVQRASRPLVARLPVAFQARMAGSQAAGRPFFGPLAPTADGPRNLLDAGALYAGESVARMHDIRPAAQLVGELAPSA